MAGYIGSKSSVTQVDGYTEAEADAEFVTKTGDTLTGDLSFGDNDKAIFGAGDDLQIYHDPSNGSIIKDNGTGRLILDSENGTGVSIMSGGIAKDMIDATKDGAVTLYHNGSSKLATTSTGVAVTGSTAHTAGDITNTISGTYNLNGANGTAGSPAYATYSFKDDPNTGMYRAAADTLTFATAGSERMRVDASGRVTKPYQPAFFAHRNGGNYTETTATAKVYIDGTRFNHGGHYDTTNNRFVAPVDGAYQFNASVNCYYIESGKQLRALLYVNGSDYVVGDSFHSANNSHDLVASVSHVIYLSANDYVEVWSFSDDGSRGFSSSTVWNTFSGYLLG